MELKLKELGLLAEAAAIINAIRLETGHDAVLSGSLALKLHGVNISRESHDIDIAIDINSVEAIGNVIGYLDDRLLGYMYSEERPDRTRENPKGDYIPFLKITQQGSSLDVLTGDIDPPHITAFASVPLQGVREIMLAKMRIIRSSDRNSEVSIKHRKDLEAIIDYCDDFTVGKRLLALCDYAKKDPLFWDMYEAYAGRI